MGILGEVSLTEWVEASELDLEVRMTPWKGCRGAEGIGVVVNCGSGEEERRKRVWR
jgi:hypothetical protein